MLHALQVWYVGLEGADLHIARVRSRGAMGGHDISESNGRERYDGSKMKLIELLARPTDLRVFDNTEEGDPQKAQTPVPKLLPHPNRGEIVNSYDLPLAAQWAKPILQAAIKCSEQVSLPSLGMRRKLEADPFISCRGQRWETRRRHRFYDVSRVARR
jgi:hypothetical protein